MARYKMTTDRRARGEHDMCYACPTLVAWFGPVQLGGLVNRKVLAVSRWLPLSNVLIVALLALGCGSSMSSDPTNADTAPIAQNSTQSAPVTRWPVEDDDNDYTEQTNAKPRDDGQTKSQKKKTETNIEKNKKNRQKTPATSRPAAPVGDISGDLRKLQGIWRIVEAEYDGKKEPDEETHKYSWSFRNSEYTVLLNGKFAEAWDVKLGSNGLYKTIDSTGSVSKGFAARKVTGIYEISGNTLRICYDLTGNGRPDEFKAPAGSRRVSYLFQRQ